MENNEFIKLKMHEAAKRSGFNTWQMESELPLLPRCADTALLIAWSCLGDTKSSQAMTWWEQGAKGLLSEKIVGLTSITSSTPFPDPPPQTTSLGWKNACMCVCNSFGSTQLEIIREVEILEQVTTWTKTLIFIHFHTLLSLIYVHVPY